MNNQVGVDTNIFIYTLDISSQYHKICEALLKDADVELFTTSKCISEFFAVCTKLNIEKDKMYGFYKELKSFVTILHSNTESLITFEKLNEKYQPKGNRVYDVEIVSVFLTNDILKIASINTNDFKFISEIELIDFDKYK